ncbi:MAG: glycoside hydrolase family 73 protein [Streptococcaceae bacterium]|jgi:mannosyl-glycoprotein endo-beta-N-acetylglucosaminidase|nr:glycoside hydrolase family 73 protein [Streptococcaceae bacterium]
MEKYRNKQLYLKTKKQYRRRRVFWSLFLIIFVFFISLVVNVEAGDSYNSSFLATQLDTYKKYNFIRELAPVAKEQQEQYGLLSSLTLAQACLESDFGESLLSAKYNNLFGMKSYSGIDEVTLNTKEFENGKWITIKGVFKVYPSWSASVKAHTLLFVNGVDWDPNHYASVLAATNYKEGAQALQEDGYATDPSYAAKLIKIIEDYSLSDYD